MNDKPGPITNQVSPEYRKECLNLALQVYGAGRGSAAEIVESAKKFYEYIHEGK